MSLQDSMNALGKSARAAAHTLSLAPAPQKKEALIAAAAALRARVADITAANDIDMKAGAEKGLSKAMLDRLLLTPDRVEAMAAGVASVRDYRYTEDEAATRTGHCHVEQPALLGELLG